MALSSENLQAELALPTLSRYEHRGGETIYSFAVPGEKAVATWEDLRGRAPKLSYWPVIFGNPKHLKRMSQLWASVHVVNVKEALEALGRIDVQQFFAKRAEQFSDERVHGEWPSSAQGMKEFTLPRNILKREEFLRSVDIGLIPADNGWEVPAKISFGGWNDAPGPEEQAAVLRYWGATFGAELVGVSNDVLELRVARRPSSREEALRLAQEQYWFCYDIVEQGVQTIENLAATLLVSDIWYFWWD